MTRDFLSFLNMREEDLEETVVRVEGVEGSVGEGVVEEVRPKARFIFSRNGIVDRRAVRGEFVWLQCARVGSGGRCGT